MVHVGNWHPKPTNARLIWQRCRMVYPFLEIANRAWLCAAAAARPEGEAEEWWGEEEAEAPVEEEAAEAAEAAAAEAAEAEAEVEAEAEAEGGEAEGGEAASPFHAHFEGVPEEWERDSSEVAYMLDRIARAGPEEKVIARCCTSAAPRPHLGRTSAAPRPHFGCTSAALRPYLGRTSAAPRPYLARR